MEQFMLFSQNNENYKWTQIEASIKEEEEGKKI